MARRVNTRFSVAFAVATTIALSSGSGEAHGQGVLAFTSDRCGEGGKPTHDYFSSRARCRDSIWLVNDDGSDPRRLTTGAFPGHEEEEGGGDFGPTWSPDGTRLVFTRGLSQGSRLVIMNADGTGQSVLLKQPLPEGFETQEEPTWSRDGLPILFTSKRFGWDYTSAIFSVDPSESARDRGERCPHMRGFERHLGVGEAQRGEPARGVRLIAQAIPGLLRRRAVVAEPVGLDDEPEVRPMEVDLVAAHAASGLRRPEPGVPGDR
jgi:hypothetical protein